MPPPWDTLNDDPLYDFALIERHRTNCVVGHRLIYQGHATSTMDMAKEWNRQEECPSGMLFVVEQQTAGRGRRGRTWETPPGRALLMSVLLRPPHYGLLPAQAPMLAGVALVDALLELAPELDGQVWLKWPNDLLLGDDPRQAGKAGGILVESSLRGDGALDYLVVGIGVNVNHSRAELPLVSPSAMSPTSIRLVLGRPLRRCPLLLMICTKMAAWLERPGEELSAAWRARLCMLGQEVIVHGSGDEVAPLIGQAVDVTEMGGLMVRDAAGELHTVYAGDVTVRAYTPRGSNGK